MGGGDVRHPFRPVSIFVYGGEGERKMFECTRGDNSRDFLNVWYGELGLVYSGQRDSE